MEPNERDKNKGWGQDQANEIAGTDEIDKLNQARLCSLRHDRHMKRLRHWQQMPKKYYAYATCMHKCCKQVSRSSVRLNRWTIFASKQMGYLRSHGTFHNLNKKPQIVCQKLLTASISQTSYPFWVPIAKCYA